MLKHFLPAIFLFAGLANTSSAASTVTLAADKTGTTDATSALNGAISAAGANGTVIIPAGTYKLTGQSGGNSGGCGIKVVTNLPTGIQIKPTGAVKFTNSNAQPAYVWSTFNNGVSIDSGATEANPGGNGSFEYAGIAGFCIYAQSNPGHLISNETFVGNYVHDLTWHNPLGGVSMGIVDGLRWQFNKFFNIDNLGYQNVTYDTIYGSSNCSGGGECSWDGAAFEFRGGIANADIGWNKISYTGNDGFHVWWDDAVSNTYYHVCNNVSVHHNTTDHIGRIAIEMQAVSSGSCAGGCKSYSPGTNFTFFSNWDQIHNLPTTNAMSWSINNDYENQQLYNNSSTIPATSNIRWFYGIALESAISGGIEQGNVIAIDYQNASRAGWGGPQTESTTGFGFTVAVNNNVVCGAGSTSDQHWPSNSKMQNFQWIHQEGMDVYGYPNMIFTGNHRAETCWNAGALQTSNIKTAFTTANNQSFTSGGTGTFKFGVVSALSIDKVAFYVDGSNTPVVTQKLQDLNYDFPTTRQWMYHASFDTSAYGAGTHTLTAVATDLSGTKASASQTFTVGSVKTNPPAAPASVSAVAASSSTISVSWSASSGASSYNVYQSNASGSRGTQVASGLKTTAYTASGLNAGTKYYFATTAVNGGGESATSAQASATTASGSLTSSNFNSGFADNGDFNKAGDPLYHWSSYSTGNMTVGVDSTAGSAYSNNSLLATIYTIGSNTQIYQQPLGLPAGRVMTLSFYARASAARTLYLNVIQDQSPYTNYGVNQQAVNISTNWTLYTVTFNSPSTAVSDARLQFILSSFSSGDRFELDHVALHQN